METLCPCGLATGNTSSLTFLADHSNPPFPSSPNLTWTNVAIGFVFVLFDAGVSSLLRLGIGISLLVASLRCVGQLALVATFLQEVFERNDPLTVAVIVFVLNLLGTIETVVNKSSCRFPYMFPIVLVTMLHSTIPIAILGTKFAMSVEPFWKPVQFIPVVGMLCGATISGMIVTISYILKEFQENGDKIEIYLAFGASRLEACRPIAVRALKLALTPQINSMSVIGIIAIPGMMTGALLGGSSVQQAARLQMIILFMITASTALSSVLVAIAAVIAGVDAEHRVRRERIIENGKGISPWAWFLHVCRGNPRKEMENERESMIQTERGGRMDSLRSLKSLRRWYVREGDSSNDDRGGPNERTRLLA